ncbi:uncharacterized protein LOC127868406 isoform X2 [Dreissena polymorpha]|uniref:uncharacterized protein LOC127868406 isoform X2 n=1 Tax=Dreissena polymorpha TaxID=45954 RepID=UPI002263C916|nr:uncharacterized protein LOC127868406 isoform X2 [Dreissena polymorpha]
MGGCIGGSSKSEELKSDTETAAPNGSYEKQAEKKEASILPDRRSGHVYCGEPKAPANQRSADVNTQGGGSPKPPRDLDTKVVSNGGVSSDAVVLPYARAGEMLNSTEAEQPNVTIVSVIDLDDTNNESKDSFPDIHKSDTSVKCHPSPLIGSLHLKESVLKRPRSLDSADPIKPVVRHLALTYSPALLKTRHPRSLHCIIEPNVHESVISRTRPQSMDLTAMFDYHSQEFQAQKLKRMLTQKVTKKPKADKQQHCNAVVPFNPGQVKYLDEGPARCFQISQMQQRKKKNKELKMKEVEYLRQAISKPRMKLSKSLEIMFGNCEQYMKYDPLLNDKVAQPSNPWMTEDQTMWDINCDMVEVPTEIRLRKWALRFEDLLRDDTGRNEFEMFLKKEYSQENIRFYKACRQLVTCPTSDVNKWKTEIEKEFLTPGAACEVNIDCKTLEMVHQQLKTDKEVSSKTRYIFQPAMEHVYALMKKDSYVRFLRSDQYKLLIERSQSVFTKKRFFNFGSNRKKAPSPQVQRRGSASSDGGGVEGELVGGPAYHSYSTGNLKELDDKPKTAVRSSNSPSLRRRTNDLEGKVAIGSDPRRRSNLEVPRSSYTSTSTTDAARKSEHVAQCIPLNVPRTNVVTPWEGES